MADYARVTSRFVAAPRYQASVTLVTRIAPGTDEVAYLSCEHEHTTEAAAERCARRLARRHTEDVR